MRIKKQLMPVIIFQLEIKLPNRMNIFLLFFFLFSKPIFLAFLNLKFLNNNLNPLIISFKIWYFHKYSAHQRI